MKKILITILLLTCSQIFSFENVKDGLVLLKKTRANGGSKVELGKIYHDLAGFELNPEWIETGLNLLEEEYKITGNPEALAYWGSLITIEGNLKYNNGDFMGALSSLEVGGGKIDKAIELDSNNVSLRFLRIINGISVGESSPVDRTNVVESDIKYINGVINTLNPGDRAMFYYYNGLLEIIKEDILAALDSLDLAVEADKNSDYGILAQKELDLWEE
ncbi:MAG: hypothetical protein JXR64_01570 [Spirochaetales bacterium]|nr:hypothetical protein [Spirochaetales bacterium]